MSLGGTPRIWISIIFKFSKYYTVPLQNSFQRKHKRAVLLLRENPIRTSQKTKEWTQVYYAHKSKKVLELRGIIVPDFNKGNMSSCSTIVCIFIWKGTLCESLFVSMALVQDKKMLDNFLGTFIPKSRNTYQKGRNGRQECFCICLVYVLKKDNMNNFRHV